MKILKIYLGLWLLAYRDTFLKNSSAYESEASAKGLDQNFVTLLKAVSQVIAY